MSIVRKLLEGLVSSTSDEGSKEIFRAFVEEIFSEMEAISEDELLKHFHGFDFRPVKIGEMIVLELPPDIKRLLYVYNTHKDRMLSVILGVGKSRVPGEDQVAYVEMENFKRMLLDRAFRSCLGHLCADKGVSVSEKLFAIRSGGILAALPLNP